MLFGLVAVVAKAVIAIRVSIERAGRNDSAFGKRLGYREREAVAVAEPATPVTATAPATTTAAPAGAASAVASGAAPTAAASADASAGTATPPTSEAATVPPEATSSTSGATPADAASGSPSADATGTSEPALEPDAIEPAEKATTTAILPRIEQPHKPSLLVRALAAAIRISNRKKQRKRFPKKRGRTSSELYPNTWTAQIKTTPPGTGSGTPPGSVPSV